MSSEGVLVVILVHLPQGLPRSPLNLTVASWRLRSEVQRRLGLRSGGQPFQVCEDTFENLLGDPGGLDSGCESLTESLFWVDVVAEVPDLVGVLRDILAQDTALPRD